ncbi:MAG: hypothetical protein GTN49_12340 [candidate division Zixibacteria bacterium]|nr:hypothetical protein [candidate division Zixibacteria bacterium]
MRRWILTAACVFVAAGTAFGALGTVVGSFPIPGGNCAGLARANAVLFSCNNMQGRIYLCNYLTGSITGSYSASGGIFASGLAYQYGRYLWQNQGIASPYYIYRKNAGTGSVINSYRLPPNRYTTGSAPLATGDGGQGTSHIILSNFDLRRIFYMTTTGSIARSHAVSQPLFDVAYDWRNRLIWGGRNSVTCYGYNTNGSLIASFNKPTGGIYGVTYHGEYLWVAGNTGYVYRIHCPGNLGVTPTSMGKIKAMFN